MGHARQSRAGTLRVVARLLPAKAELDVNLDVFANAGSILAAFSMATDLIGGDPDRPCVACAVRRHT
jgi:hypothetical protein